jgi:tetratricopeptide (TPR) repeat protein
MKYILVALIGFVFFMTAPSAIASSDVVYEQTAEWVKSANLQQVLDENPDSEAVLVILDQQKQLEFGKVSSYIDVAVRIDSTKTMSNMLSLFRPSWHPDQGNLIIHRYEIIRGEQTIDLLETDNLFDVIRREKNLERQQINGMLTAISQIENLQLDDIVRMSYTITTQNEALSGRVQSSGGFVTSTVNVDFVRQTVRWPNKLNVSWRGSKEEIIPVESRNSGWTTISLDYRPKEPKVKIPKNAPNRFQNRNHYEVSSFTSWKDVSRVNAALYPLDERIEPGGDLEAQIQAIADQTSDDGERMVLAVRLVQDKVRYLYNGMGFGNYTPQTPEETWRLRYGDCKAKTYLLLVTLRRLGIKASPMLVSTSQRDAVADRLPSFQAFNHIIVKAELDGKTYWLDGTQSGTRASDIADSPTHRYGLTSVAGGSDLEEIPIRRPGRPYQDVQVTYDLAAGTKLPVPFEVYAVLRDTDAQKLKNTIAQRTEEKAKELMEETALQYVLDGLVTETEFTFNEDEEIGYLSAKGLAYLDWKKKTDRYQHETWSMADTFKIQKVRDEEELRDLPVLLNYPRYFRYQVTYKLPDRYAGAELKGQTEVEDEFGGFQFNRQVRKSGNQVVTREEHYTGRWELPAREFELQRRKLASLTRKGVEILLPENVAGPWVEIENYKKTDGLERHRQAFDTHVANAKYDDPDPLANRAYFFQLIGDYERAMADVQAALAIESDPENQKWLADLQVGSDAESAIESYQEAIRIKPAYFDALLALTRLHIRRNEFEEAKQVLKDGLERGLKDADADSIKIEILIAEGKFDEAMSIVNALVDEEPDSASYLADRCLVRTIRNTNLDLALDDCTNMIELAKRGTYYHFLRALVHYRKGDYQNAVDDLDKSLKVNDELGYVYRARSAANQRLGNLTQAEDDLQASKFFYKYSGWYWSHFWN